MSATGPRGIRIMFVWVLLVIALCCWIVDHHLLKKALVREEAMHQETKEDIERLETLIRVADNLVTLQDDIHVQIMEVVDLEEESELPDNFVPPE